ncbi:hypothetical protein BaRGS_00038528, partial [Batillaria attramentaria]
ILQSPLGLSIIAILGNTYLADGSRSSCQATPVVKGDRATITCYFEDEVSAADSRINIDKYNATNHLGSGYTFNNKITNPLVLVIPVVNEQHAGTYVCHLLPSDKHDMEPCTLTVTDPVTTPPMDVTPKSTKEFGTTEIDDGVTGSGTTSKGVTAGAGHGVMSPALAAGIGGICLVAILVVIFILLFRRCRRFNRWVKERLGCTRGSNSNTMLDGTARDEHLHHSGASDGEAVRMVPNGNVVSNREMDGDVDDDREYRDPEA